MWLILTDKQIFRELITQKAKNEKENIKVDPMEECSTKCTEQNKLRRQD